MNICKHIGQDCAREFLKITTFNSDFVFEDNNKSEIVDLIEMKKVNVDSFTKKIIKT